MTFSKRSKAVSNYLTVITGNHTTRVNSTNTSNSVINANLNFAANTNTTILAVNRTANIEQVALQDNNAPPAAGQVKVRLVHAAPNAGNVDIYIIGLNEDINTAVPTLTNIPFKSASDYLEAPAGNYRVRITPIGTKTVAIDSGTVNLINGRIVTAVAIGDPGVGQPLEAITFTSN